MKEKNYKKFLYEKELRKNSINIADHDREQQEAIRVENNINRR